MSAKLSRKALRSAGNQVAVDHISQGIEEGDRAAKTLEGKNEELQRRVVRAEDQLSKSLVERFSQDLPSDPDLLVSQIAELRSHSLQAAWLIGQRLQKIRDEKLYSSEESFSRFCETRLSMTRVSAYRYVFVYETLNIKQVVTSKLQPSKLHLLQPHRSSEEFSDILAWLLDENPTRKEVLRELGERFPRPESDRNPSPVTVGRKQTTVRLTGLRLRQLEESEAAEIERRIRAILQEYEEPSMT